MVRRERSRKMPEMPLRGSLIAAGLTELPYTFRQRRTKQDELEQMEEK